MPSPVSEPPRDSDKLRVFISFSRRDLLFARKLVKALEARSIDVYIDERDLPLAVEFQAELLDFIRNADAVVFLISAASLKSQWCRWELDQVAALSKRLAPVLIEVLADVEIPEPVRKINFVNLTNPDTFEADVDRLTSALKTDIQWVKAHTRWGERARRWDELGRARSTLLRGAELENAEKWLRDRPRDAPDPTKLHTDFIAASRVGATQRQRAWVVGSSLVASFAITLASYAFVQRSIARDRAVQLMVDHAKRDISDGNLLGAWRWFAEALVTDTDRGGQGAHRERIAGTQAQLPELTFNAVAATHGAMLDFSPDGAWLLTGDEALMQRIDVGAHKTQDLPATALSSGRCWLTHVDFLRDQPNRILLVKNCSAEDLRWGELEVKDFVSMGPPVSRKLPLGDVNLSTDGSRALVVPAGKDTGEARAATVYEVLSWQPLGQVQVKTSGAIGTLSGNGHIAAIMDGPSITIYAVDGSSSVTLLRQFVIAEGEGWSRLKLSADGRFVIASSSRQLLLWRTDNDKPMLARTSADELIDVAFSPDACHFLATFEREDRSRRSEMWNACESPRDDPERVVEHETSLEAWHRALARGGAAAGSVVGARAKNPLQHAAIFGPDGETLATVSAQFHSFRIWRRADGMAMTPALGLLGTADPVIAISPDGRAIAATDYTGRTRMWRLDAIAAPSVLTPVRNRIDSLFFTPDGAHLVAAFFGGSKAIWRTKGSRRAETEFATYSNDTSAIVYDGRNDRLITGGFGKAVFVWDMAAGALAARVINTTNRITALLLDAQGKRLVVETEAENGRTAQLFELPSGQPLSSLTSIGSGSLIALDPAGNKALMRRDDGVVLLNASDGRTIGTSSKCTGTHIRFTADGSAILCFGPTDFRHLSPEGGPDLIPPVRNASVMNSTLLAVSDDGTRALIQGRNFDSAQVVDTRTGRPISKPLEHPASIRISGFASGGKMVYTSTARSVFLWSADTGDPISPPLRQDNDINGIAIDPSGRQLAVSLSEFGTAASASNSALVLWPIKRAVGTAEALRLQAEVNSGLRIEELGGAVPLQPEQFDASWKTWESVHQDSVGTRSHWRLGRLEQSRTDFARDFHIQWARREKLADGEFDLATIERNPNLTDAQRVELLEHAVSAGISDWSVFLDLGKAYQSMDRWPEAITTLRRALGLRRDDPTIWIKLADALLRTGSHEEQNKFCSEMYDYFFAYQLQEAAWNVTAGSCALFHDVDARPKLLDAARKSGLDKSEGREIDAVFYSVLLYRQSGVEAVASRLQIGEQFVATRLLKALYLQHTGQTAEAQATIDAVLADFDRYRTDSLVTALLMDAEEAGLRIHPPAQGHENTR
ncbi:TIR domain-containing protein [Bradyrhizobium canariense]|uniref:TIR domain-containing protein n=1 Tax=Bradyrhizobium canariense TaxID=255045 RepID=UPI0013747298|nr:TIR domain-containing protein [Bradyrhizobium canariense]